MTHIQQLSGKTLSGIKAKFVANSIESDLDVGVTANTTSKYGETSETGKTFGKDIYIRLDDDVILENEESLAIYITYRLGEDSDKDSKYSCTYNNGRGNETYAILQDVLTNEDAELQINTLTEVNGFKTFHKKTDEIADTQRKYNYTEIRGYNYRPAGVLDCDSEPGNLNDTEINTARENVGKSIQQRLPIEDDWDDAATLVIKTPTDTRTITGNVWETVGQNAYYWTTTAEYATFNESYKNVKDITVELIEIKDGQEYIRAATSTNENGEYSLNGFIPGDYTIRFIYGDKAKYDSNPDDGIDDSVQYSPYTTFTINKVNEYDPGETIYCAYNGQFYQSAKANPETNESQFWYVTPEGEEEKRYSDAYDEVNIRRSVNTGLQEYTYKEIIDALKHPTDYMTYAYTSLMDIYPEKAKTETVEQNPGYTISNVDFGLTPRTMSDLRIKKEVSHVKLILQNGIVQFDADTATIREQGVPGVVQALQGYDINISMSSELVNGATLEITYTITVTNNTPKETIIYYKDSASNHIAVALYSEEASELIYYENAMRVYKDNATNFERLANENWVSKVEPGTTELVEMDDRKTEIRDVTAKPLEIADFVPNNLNFIKNDYTGKAVNGDWDLYTGTKAEFEERYYQQDADAAERATPPTLGNMEEQAQEIYDSNAIALANGTNPLVTTPLESGESVSTNIVLSKVIATGNNSTDTKSYKNKVRIIKIFNSESEIQDLVGAESERVIISDPTGIGNKYLVIALSLVVLVIIGTGVVMIKKFVIPRR